jgi:hypothetical protein
MDPHQVSQSRPIHDTYGAGNTAATVASSFRQKRGAGEQPSGDRRRGDQHGNGAEQNAARNRTGSDRRRFSWPRRQGDPVAR